MRRYNNNFLYFSTIFLSIGIYFINRNTSNIQDFLKIELYFQLNFIVLLNPKVNASTKK